MGERQGVVLGTMTLAFAQRILVFGADPKPSSRAGVDCWLRALLFMMLLLLFLITQTNAEDDSRKPLLRFQSDGQVTVTSRLTYLGWVPELGVGATFCFSLWMQQSRDLNTIISYAVQDYANEIFFSVNFLTQSIVFLCCDGQWRLTIRQKVFLREWLSICLALDFVERRWEAAINGRIVSGGGNKPPSSLIKIREGGIFIIGQDQDNFNGNFNLMESLCGYLLDLRVYDTVLTRHQMVNFTTCKNFTTESPPVVDFSNIHEQFSVQDVEIAILENDDYCDTLRNFDVIFPELRDFPDSVRLCHVVGGKIKVPQNEADNEQLFNKSKEFTDMCGEGFPETFWLGVQGDVPTQTWLHYVNKTPVTYKKMNKDYGSVIEDQETCIGFIGEIDVTPDYQGGWTPKACHFELCSVCSLERIKLIRMRGLCKQSHFDRDYFITYDEGSPAFTGVTYSRITKHPPNKMISDSEHGFWTLKRLDRPRVLALLDMKSPAHYPIGRNQWRVNNDVCGEEEVRLVMTSCEDGQFSCADGTCVYLYLRCDLVADCPDESDEVNCKFFRLPEGYNSNKAPSRVGQHGSVRVYLHINLLSLRHIDLSKFKFTCEIDVHLRWTDSRLSFLHLNHAEMLNVIDDSEDMPWLPRLDFLGDGNTTSIVQKQRESIRVRRASDSLPDNDENVLEDEIFSGKYNSLIMSRKLTVQSSCDFNLEAFPFDEQTCSIGIMMASATSDYVILVPDGEGVSFEGQRKLQEYYLVSEVMLPRDEGIHSGQAVVLTFNNMSTFYIISTYVPTFIIVIIGCLVFFFPVWSFNERIMVSLTGLLVEATFFSQVSASIPHTAYLKLVDTWFVFCIMFLFLVVVALVIINWLQEETKVQPMQAWSLKNSKVLQTRANKVNSACRLAFPMFAALFLIVYYIIVAV